MSVLLQQLVTVLPGKCHISFSLDNLCDSLPLAARESTPIKRNCVANFVAVKACYVLVVKYKYSLLRTVYFDNEEATKHTVVYFLKLK